MTVTRLRQAIGTLQDAIRSECKGGPDAPVEEAQAEVDAAIEELVGGPNDTVSEDAEHLIALGQKEADFYAEWLRGNDGSVLSPFALRGLAHSFGHILASTKPASPLPGDWDRSPAAVDPLPFSLSDLDRSALASPPMPGRGEGFVSVQENVLSAWIDRLGTAQRLHGLPLILQDMRSEIGGLLAASRPQEDTHAK